MCVWNWSNYTEGLREHLLRMCNRPVWSKKLYCFNRLRFYFNHSRRTGTSLVFETTFFNKLRAHRSHMLFCLLPQSQLMCTTNENENRTNPCNDGHIRVGRLCSFLYSQQEDAKLRDLRSLSGVDEDWNLLGCYTVSISLGTVYQSTRRNMQEDEFANTSWRLHDRWSVHRRLYMRDYITAIFVEIIAQCLYSHHVSCGARW